MDARDRDLGMHRDISRRDFLNGAAVALTGALVAPPWLGAYGLSTGQNPEQAADYYPPLRTGMRGSHPGSFEVGHQLRDRRSWAQAAEDTGEIYDLIVVGGGISGLSAAHFFRAAAGPQARVLVLDNHDDFGGHAKRNEFQREGRTLLLNGGTLNIEGPGQYSPQAMGLLRTLGIDIERFEKEIAPDHNIYSQLKLRNGVWFNKERFGTDRLVVGTPGGFTGATGNWPEFLARTPLASQAQADIARLVSKEQPDYMPGLTSDEKKEKLLHISYQDFLLSVAKVHPDVVWFYQTRSDGLFLMHIDMLPAFYAWNMNYPGFQGMHLEPTPPEALINEPGGAHGRENQARASAAGRAIHFPDGNATIARLLVRSLIPAAVPGRTQEDVVTSRVNYALLDQPSNPTRIRLNSIVVHTAHVGDSSSAKEVAVSYVRGGKTYRVRGGSVVMACWNFMIPYLCPEMPDKQKEALAYGIKAPIVYTSVLVRDWTAFARLGVQNISAPGGYHSDVQLPEPVSIGEYQDVPNAARADGAASGQDAMRAGKAAQGAAPTRTRGTAPHDVRNLRTRDSQPARTNPVGGRVRPGARRRSDHGQPLAARLHVQLQHARRSRRMGAVDARRPCLCRRPPPVRADHDRQRRRGRQLAYRRRHRHGPPGHRRNHSVADIRLHLED